MLLKYEPIASHIAPSGDIFGGAWVESGKLKKFSRKHCTKFTPEQ
jgi:hypothetical protein